MRPMRPFLTISERTFSHQKQETGSCLESWYTHIVYKRFQKLPWLARTHCSAMRIEISLALGVLWIGAIFHVQHTFGFAMDFLPWKSYGFLWYLICN